MRQKPNLAMNTERDELAQLAVDRQKTVQSGLILADKRIDAIILVPVLAKSEELLDCQDKKARVSLIMLSEFFTLSS